MSQRSECILFIYLRNWVSRHSAITLSIKITKMEDPNASTLYPKITNHIPEIIRTLKLKKRSSDEPEVALHLDPIPITGTVKLHGTHADIIVTADNDIIFQSRNNTNLHPTADNFEFATTLSKKGDIILRLRNQFATCWKNLNPDAKLDTTIPVTIAGEWIGSSIQKGVAIANLSKRFVIISAKINGSWVSDEPYADIEAPEDGIYNISRGGFYHSTLHPWDLQKTISELEELAEKVAARCPFAESFGIIGNGEGLVWKLDPYVSDSSLWFKTKGGKFKPTFAPAPKKLPADAKEKREAAVALVKIWCGEQRLEQGWDYLREKGVPRSMKGIGEFLKWVQLDILVEEKGYIKEHDVDEGFLRPAIIGVAKPWFLRRLSQGTE